MPRKWLLLSTLFVTAVSSYLQKPRMAVGTSISCNLRHHCQTSYAFAKNFSSPFVPKLMGFSFRRLPFVSLRHQFRRFAATLATTTVGSGCSGRFTWEDVFRFCDSIRSDSIDPQGFFDKISLCNRNSVSFNLALFFHFTMAKCYEYTIYLRISLVFFLIINLRFQFQDKQCEFLPFVLEDQIVGYVHSR